MGDIKTLSPEKKHHILISLNYRIRTKDINDLAKITKLVKILMSQQNTERITLKPNNRSFTSVVQILPLSIANYCSDI